MMRKLEETEQEVEQEMEQEMKLAKRQIELAETTLEARGLK